MKLLRSMVVVGLVAGLLVVLAPSPAGATINVNTTTDELNSDGDCSLREAIDSINSALAADACGSTTGPIVLPAGTYQVTGTFTISASMTVRGAGAGSTIIDSTGLGGTVFNLPGAASFTLEEVTVNGGAPYYLNGPCGPSATLTVNDSVFDGPGSYGINNCTGPIFVNRSTISGAGSYGINNNDGDVSLTDSEVSGAGSYGINTNGGSSTLVRSTVSGTGGYGINANDGGVSLINSTVSGSASYGINVNTGVISLESSTVVGGARYVLNSNNTTASITNSIVVGGSPDACNLPVTSGGYNISDDASCGFDQATDRENTDPELGSLADNGGPTRTHLPQTGSPAIDTGGDCPSDDQRSEPRPADGDDDGDAACDRGAVEIQPPPAPTTTTTATTIAGSPTAAPQPATPAFTG